MMVDRPLEVYENYYGCWIVISHKGKAHGYSQFERNGKRWRIHRWMYQKHRGEIPEGMLVCHECDNKGCVNPHHLFIGTHKDNMQDALAKGRLALGERNGSAKLTEKIVKEVRRIKGTVREIGERFGISADYVRLIQKGRRWGWLV